MGRLPTNPPAALSGVSSPGISDRAARSDHTHALDLTTIAAAVARLLPAAPPANPAESAGLVVERAQRIDGDKTLDNKKVNRYGDDFVTGTLTVGVSKALNQVGTGIRLTAAAADGTLDDIPQAVWTPEVPEVPVVPYTLEANPDGATSFPWDIAAYGTRIFCGNAHSPTYGAYEGSVDYYDTSTDAWARIAPPEVPAFSNTSFGSNVLVVGGTLYVGAYGYGYPFTSDGRIYRFNADTLAYLGALPDSGEAPAGRQLGRPGTMCGDAAAGTLFAAVSTAYAATGGIYVYQNDLYVGRFDITGGYEFGAIVEMSPDKAWIATTNKPTLGSAAELVVLSVSGTTLAEVQRIANPSASNYWGQKVRWDNDSLGFWSTGADGVPTHYRWDGASFALTTTPSLTGVAIVCPALEDGKILVDRTTTVELCDEVTGAVEYTWTGKVASSGWTTIRRITSSQFVSGDGGGATAGIGIGASEIPAIPGKLDIAGDLEADRLRITSQAGTGVRLVTADAEGDQEAQSKLTFDGTTLDVDAIARVNTLRADDQGGSTVRLVVADTEGTQSAPVQLRWQSGTGYKRIATISDSNEFVGTNTICNGVGDSATAAHQAVGAGGEYAIQAAWCAGNGQTVGGISAGQGAGFIAYGTNKVFYGSHASGDAATVYFSYHLGISARYDTNGWTFAQRIKVTADAGLGERMLVAQPDGTHRDVDEVTWDGTDIAVSGDPLTTRSRAIAYALIFG